ncbi:MAG TPA: hypothetical protein VND87_04990, partial [Stellaceae bacterium]|nr:hypothetical protein [Stellaceae bacterium]
MGPLPRSFAADAHDCIMVEVRTGPTEYKCVARCSALDGELPLDRPAPSFSLSTGSNTEQTGSNGIDRLHLTPTGPIQACPGE